MFTHRHTGTQTPTHAQVFYGITPSFRGSLSFHFWHSRLRQPCDCSSFALLMSVSQCIQLKIATIAVFLGGCGLAMGVGAGDPGSCRWQLDVLVRQRLISCYPVGLPCVTTVELRLTTDNPL